MSTLQEGASPRFLQYLLDNSQYIFHKTQVSKLWSKIDDFQPHKNEITAGNTVLLDPATLLIEGFKNATNRFLPDTQI